MKPKVKVCYLCGKLLGDEIDLDHIPPKQFYPSEFRRRCGPNLFTLPVHPLCNKSYQKDEDYFINSVGPLAMESFSGKVLWEELVSHYKRPQNKRILEMVLKEFNARPSGLILPFDKVAKRFNAQRIKKIAWKIVRGLFFKEIGQSLPENLSIKYEMLSPGESPLPKYDILCSSPLFGQYPAIFNYRYVGITGQMYLWAMVFWDRIIILIGFHVPGCGCKICITHQ